MSFIRSTKPSRFPFKALSSSVLYTLKTVVKNKFCFSYEIKHVNIRVLILTTNVSALYPSLEKMLSSNATSMGESDGKSFRNKSQVSYF